MSLSHHKKNNLTSAISMAILSLGVLTANGALAQESEKKSPKAEEIEVIQVTGILGSLEASARIKRYADTVVDVITSEDIGQFSDDSIAGAIQRIPGVQIETDDAGTDGDRVSIRGLGPEFVNSTINGRRLLSSGNEGRNLRKMNFNAFPPNVLSGVKVTKGSTANSPESGLAGQIDLETLKPLESRKLKKKNSYTNVGFQGGLNDTDNETGYRANFITVIRNDDNDFGGYISLVLGEERSARDQLKNNYEEDATINIDNNGDGVIDVDDGDEIKTGVSAPISLTYNPIRENPKRIALAMGLQYQPNEDIDINWDIMFSEYNKESTRDQYLITMNRNRVWRDGVFDNSEAGNPAVVFDENNVVRYADFANADNVELDARSTAFLFNNKTENFVTGLNIDWAINDGFTANFDVYVSTLDYQQESRFVRFEKTLDSNTFIYDGTESISTITAPDADVIEGWGYGGTSIRLIASEGENYGATAAFEYDIDESDIFSSIHFGAHFDRTDIYARRTGKGERVTFLDDNGELLRDDTGNIITNDGANTLEFDDADNTNVDIDSDAILAAAFTGDRLPDPFLGGDVLSSSNYFVADYDAAVAVDPRIASYGFDELGIDPLSSYKMTEDIYALYTQVNLATEVFGLPMTGNFGMRAVFTDNKATALQELTLENGDIAEEFVTTNNDYWTYLPSLNLNFALNDNMALRFGVSRTMSRPDYQETAPINTIRIDNDGVDNRATVGNPNLKPMSSENLDITYEWYTQYDGAFILSGFYKEIKDFIVTRTLFNQELDGFDDTFELRQSINFSDATAEGVEIGLLQPLGKLIPALDGFGFAVNYTYVDSALVDEDAGDAGFGLPGSSKDNFNFSGFYEADFYSIRLAYTYRGSFFRTLGGTGSQGNNSRFSGEQEKLNLNLNLKPMKGLSVRLSANNITDEKRRDFLGNESTFLDYFDRGRTYSVSARYSF